MLTLYALLLWRALRIMAGARDQLGTLIAAGVVAIFMFQVFVNVGMNIGIMPITGVTLPLLFLWRRLDGGDVHLLGPVAVRRGAFARAAHVHQPLKPR